MRIGSRRQGRAASWRADAAAGSITPASSGRSHGHGGAARVTRITVGIWRRFDGLVRSCGRGASSRAPRAGKVRGYARGLANHTRAHRGFARPARYARGRRQRRGRRCE
jgi:hypothetical protein